MCSPRWLAWPGWRRSWPALLKRPRPTEVVAGRPERWSQFCAERAAVLEDAGIGVLLPAWWAAPARLGLRARARSSSRGGGSAGARRARPGALVDFKWEAALGGRASDQGRAGDPGPGGGGQAGLVRLRGEWVEIRPDRIDALLARVGDSGRARRRADASGSGPRRPGPPGGARRRGRRRRGVGWLGALLDDAVHSTVAPMPTPAGFDGQLCARTRSEASAGWCSSDGSAWVPAWPTTWGSARRPRSSPPCSPIPATGPALVVCPVSVLGNWERELARFAPALSGDRPPRAATPRSCTRVSEKGRPLTTWSSPRTRFWRATSSTWRRSSGQGSSSTRHSR